MGDRILWHYTSSDAFTKIVSSKMIRLSSMKVSNDFREGRLAGEALVRLAHKDSRSPSQIEAIENEIRFLEGYMDGLAFCLSKKRDSLGQWRGYADDGHGFSIGFSENVLREIALLSIQGDEVPYPGFTVRDVHYEYDEHDKLMRPAYERIKEIMGEGGMGKASRLAELLISRTPAEQDAAEKNSAVRRRKFSEAVFSIIGDLYCLKSPAFSEEEECRLISLLFFSAAGSVSNCLHYGKRSQLVPYREFSIAPEKNPIKAVLIGPKNITPIAIVRNLLKSSNYSDVTVESSVSSYR